VTLEQVQNEIRKVWKQIPPPWSRTNER
jgi:hypothetical protein